MLQTMVFITTNSSAITCALTWLLGFTVVAFNRTVAKVDHFLENEAKGRFLPSIGLFRC